MSAAELRDLAQETADLAADRADTTAIDSEYDALMLAAGHLLRASLLLERE